MADGGFEAADLSRLMAEQRPRLHRYCARMVGSAVEGEDVVQDALAKAAEAFAATGPIEKPASWLFRIAHNTALDALRHRRRHVAAHAGPPLGEAIDPVASADTRVAATASLASFMDLPATQRAAVLLGDVLGYSLAETGDILGLSLPAVKAALHRGRTRLKQLATAPQPPVRPQMAAEERDRLQAYADRFNARDFDALRALLAEDVQLDLVNRTRLSGRKDVSVYFSRYSETSTWRFHAGFADGRPALLVSDPTDPAEAVRYVVLLDWTGGRISRIHDFHYAAYVTEAMTIARL